MFFLRLRREGSRRFEDNVSARRGTTDTMDVTLVSSGKWWGQHVQEDQKWVFNASTLAQGRSLCQALRMDDPLHVTIEEFAAEGYAHVSCHCPRCCVTYWWGVQFPNSA